MWVVAVLAYFVAGFGVWRKVRGEYEDEEILKLEMVLGVAVGGGAAIFGTWGAVGLGLVTLGWWCRRKTWDFWEWLDSLAIVALAAGAIAGLNWVWGAGVAGVGLTARYYRGWRWYRSGRPGLAGLTAIMAVAAGEIVVANPSRFRLYWGDLELAQWIGVWSAVAAGVAIYLRAGRKITEDLWRKTIKRKG